MVSKELRRSRPAPPVLSAYAQRTYVNAEITENTINAIALNFSQESSLPVKAKTTKKIIKGIAIILVNILPLFRHEPQTHARILREEHTGKPCHKDRHDSQHIRQAVGLVLRLGIRLPCACAVLRSVAVCNSCYRKPERKSRSHQHKRFGDYNFSKRILQFIK